MASVLLLPGWHNSGPDHWQSLWEAQYGDTRVVQHDWSFPLRGDWMAQLEEAVLAHDEVVLAAHSLGCILVAAWAAHSQHTERVLGALLVAPGDVERPEMQHVLHTWSPIVRARLPFQSVLAASRNDPPLQLHACQSNGHGLGRAPGRRGPLRTRQQRIKCG